jgi:hypothetical protein
VTIEDLHNARVLPPREDAGSLSDGIQANACLGASTGETVGCEMELSNAAALLDPQPLPLEMGVKRLDSGQLLVAARTDMYGCKGRMFEWWFRYAPDTQQYIWWHPLDHLSSHWCHTNGRTHIGSTHVITERFGPDSPPAQLVVQFVDPAELFGEEEVATARERGDVSAIIYGHGGHAELGPDDTGRPIGTRVLHLARDTEWGMVLRTRFWMGVGIPEESARAIPENAGLDLMQHADSEFHYLSKFLPSLYTAENRQAEPITLPW